MFADNTLTPREATRLCLLGTLALGPVRYSALATAVRHFSSRLLGPSIELMHSSIELLKFEGLIEPLAGVGMEDDAELRLTEAGQAELRALLTARLRAGSNDLNKLLLALKFRFLHLLEPAEQREQIDLLVEAHETELARLLDLRAHHAEDAGHLIAWLDHDIEAVEGRLRWLADFRESLSA